MNDVKRHRIVKQASLAADALSIEDVKLCRAERRGNLVFDNLGLCAVSHHGGSILELLPAADVDAHGRIELERPAARRRLRIAVHDPHLLAKLVDEQACGIGLVDDAGQLAQSLAHQPGLKADKGFPHFAVNLRFGHQRGHRIDDHDINRARAHERLADLQRLLTRIRLGDIELIHIHAELAGIHGIKRVLRIDKRGHAAHLLRLRHHMQRHRRLAG